MLSILSAIKAISNLATPYTISLSEGYLKKRCQRRNEIKELFFISLLHDLQKLNEEPQQNVDSLPNIDTILHQLGNARYFSAFDLTFGFPKYSRKTAFSAPHEHYKYRQMPN